jgi:hypothetical protein
MGAGNLSGYLGFRNHDVFEVLPADGEQSAGLDKRSVITSRQQPLAV